MTTAAQRLPAGHQTLSLEGCSVVVTGGSRGIGAACATACARAGARELVLLARTHRDIERVAAVLRGFSCCVLEQACDVTDTGALQAALARVDRIDVLVNCAGTNQPEPFLDVDPFTFDRLWQLNVKATFFAAQAAARRMIDTKTGGVIVNVSSQMGHVGAVSRSVYCTTKHAVEGMTKALAVELAPHKIRVVSVAPTFVRTAMTSGQLDDPLIGPRLLEQIPLGRFAYPEDVASAVVFAASPAARMLTGTSLVIDGGWTAK